MKNAFVTIAIVLGLLSIAAYRTTGGYSLIDSEGGATVSIQQEHHEIHEGHYYRAGYQKDVASGDSAVLAITTPNTDTRLHFRPAVDHELEEEIKLYEAPSSVTGGTALTPRNADRNSSNTSTATLVYDPTVDVSGSTLLGNLVLGSNKSSGGNAESAFEWILKQNTKYALIVKNQVAGSANEVNIRTQWYEE